MMNFTKTIVEKLIVDDLMIIFFII